MLVIYHTGWSIDLVLYKTFLAKDQQSFYDSGIALQCFRIVWFYKTFLQKNKEKRVFVIQALHCNAFGLSGLSLCHRCLSHNQVWVWLLSKYLGLCFEYSHHSCLWSVPSFGHVMDQQSCNIVTFVEQKMQKNATWEVSEAQNVLWH